MKCAICNQKIEETFLKKVVGTIIKDEKGKKRTICPNCQRLHPTKQEQLEKL